MGEMARHRGEQTKPTATLHAYCETDGLSAAQHQVLPACVGRGKVIATEGV